ncbi:PhnD/SsuA/transferrin family substrate-binding protein [Marinobacter xiaoshiensis]|uniref:PhnD/SsuA/transferrin family substrate-binding protein n=1 Tax=Marinobacter xiaoshiensis TaxID=3073652 RepID=A0ABU2HJW3_9GAMM|nr:PhnD/SsuA/transferrin family substrate-binding protein [Marinobacter sp. F60267]MDS1311357.1 PhnD/SsuA/transferrin family substrate-binding protein [Marinobacter sp. F60267]
MCLDYRRTGAVAFTALLLAMPVAQAAREARVVLTIDSVTQVTDVARYRLGQHLAKQGCQADIRFNRDPDKAALVFSLSGEGNPGAAALIANNRDGDWARPVWITRKTAGVRSISELKDRDLATVAGEDPFASKLPLAALGAAGIYPPQEKIYEAGDYSSALSLLLHNNTHAAMSEAGFAGQFLTSRDLEILWLGSPVKTVGWYRGKGWSEQAQNCEEALSRLSRTDDKQAFSVFPEWVHGFARTDNQ